MSMFAGPFDSFAQQGHSDFQLPCVMGVGGVREPPNRLGRGGAQLTSLEVKFETIFGGVNNH